MTTTGFANTRASETETHLKKSEELSYKSLVDELRSEFRNNTTKDLNWRFGQLDQISLMLKENYSRITDAIRADHGGSKFRTFFDMAQTVEDLSNYKKNLRQWARPGIVPNVGSMFGKSYLRKEPKGVVLLIAPWNFPFAMVFDVLIGVIGAGNCCVIKPSEVSENSCALIKEMVERYLDPRCIKVVTGGVAETTALLREKYDHIMYTGNGHVGRIIMTAAAKHLTPVTLELGGKSPVYVHETAKVKMAAQRVSQTKWINVGQICVAPDYILVHERVADAFKDEMIKIIKSSFGNSLEERKKNVDYARIINGRHVKRIDAILKESKGKILIGGENEADEHFFDATILENPSLEDKILKEEIFGPVLPILTVSSVQEAVSKVHQICEDPLALYIFAEDRKTIDYFLDNTKSGGVTVNSTLEHLGNYNLPFGGVGESGMGRYHGKWGFDEFSHMRSVVERGTTFFQGPMLPLPPYNDKVYDFLVKLKITGFLTDSQKSALKAGVAALAAAGGLYLWNRARL